jgi:hypothetical protein
VHENRGGRIPRGADVFRDNLRAHLAVNRTQ